MGLRSYEEEKIFRRVNKDLDLRRFAKATNDRDRFREFKRALAKNDSAKNLLKMKRASLRKIFEFAIADQVRKGTKSFQTSLKRFAETRQRRIRAFEGLLSQDVSDEKLFKKAEGKGVLVRSVKIKKTDVGRPPTEIVKLEEITVSKIYVLNGKRVKSIYKKGRRGAIARIEVNENS